MCLFLSIKNARLNHILGPVTTGSEGEDRMERTRIKAGPEYSFFVDLTLKT